MDELLGEFLAETGESLDRVDLELVRFEQEPDNAEMLNAIFRLVHTVKGTCGFIGLQRLAKLAHAAETLIGQYRDRTQVTVEGVSLVLATIDRIKHILSGIERTGSEPPGSDADLIGPLESIARTQAGLRAQAARGSRGATADVRDPLPQAGEAPLEELERAWRAAPGPEVEPLAAPDGSRNGDRAGIDAQARSQTVRVQRRYARAFDDHRERARAHPQSGGETELDRQVLEQIKDPLTHMICNSADHGLIVTAIDLRRRLGLPPRSDGAASVAVGIEERGELYGLIVDKVSDALWLSPATHDVNPVNLDPRWARVCAGVHRLNHGLMVVLDVDKVLDLARFGAAA